MFQMVRLLFLIIFMFGIQVFFKSCSTAEGYKLLQDVVLEDYLHIISNGKVGKVAKFVARRRNRNMKSTQIRQNRKDTREPKDFDEHKMANKENKLMQKQAEDFLEKQPGPKCTELDKIKDNTEREIREKVNLAKFYPDDKECDFSHSVIPNPYIIRNEDICNNIKDLAFVIIVSSAAPNFSQRQTIRHTWGSNSHYKNHAIKLVFVLATPRVPWLQKYIEEENAKFNDIVQGSFLDTYYNLTHKSVLGLRWVNDHCMNSRMIIKVDDDVVVNMFELINIMDKRANLDDTASELLCHLRKSHTSRVLRNEGNKWAVDPAYFRNQLFYPFALCDGFFALITPAAINGLYKTARYTPFFWIEDVYVTGILPSISEKIKHTHIPGLMLEEFEGLDCLENNRTDCYIVAALASTTNEIRNIWTYIEDFSNE